MKTYNLSVSDNGCGINEEDRKNIFQPNFKTRDPESRKRNAESRGLGLSICYRLAQSLGGDLTFTSNAMSTVFCLKLNLKDVSPPEAMIPWTPVKSKQSGINLENSEAGVS